MRWCRECGAKLEWVRENGMWIPLDEDGIDHRALCKKDLEYKSKIHRKMKDEPIQIGEDEFI